MEQHVNEWRNKLCNELMVKLATEHLVQNYSLDETGLYTTNIGG